MKKVFQILNQMVRDGEVVNYAIGGAIAAVFYVEPFATQDVDVFVTMETESAGLVLEIPGWNYLKRRGYTEVRGEAIVVEDWPVQFIPVSNALEEEAYLNANALDFVARVQMFLSQEAVDQEILMDIIGRHGLEKQWTELQRRGSQ